MNISYKHIYNTMITRTNIFNLSSIAPAITLNGNSSVIIEGITYTDANTIVNVYGVCDMSDVWSEKVVVMLMELRLNYIIMLTQR